MNNVAERIEAACESACHKPLAKMIKEMVEAFVDAKMERADISVALYRVSADKFAIDIMLAAMAGAMRSLLEAGPSPSTVLKSREQLVLLCQSYMTAAIKRG